MSGSPPTGAPRISVRIWVAALAGSLGVTSLLALAGALARGEGSWWPLAALGIGALIAIGAWRAAAFADGLADEAPPPEPIPLRPDGEDPASVDGEGLRKAA